MFLITSAITLSLFIVGVVLSRGPARVLLAAWVVVHALSIGLTVVAPQLVGAVGIGAWSLTNALIGFGGSLLLGIALIVGRPGHRGDEAPMGPTPSGPFVNRSPGPLS